ncbi:MAG: TVP38/TMEM64 family protein [Proteobacteria bacterium]|nr:TVP38/TMEM64 family protein [Pseudomonadota bacterium]
MLAVVVTLVAAAWVFVSHNLTLERIQSIAGDATDLSNEHFVLVFIALASAQAIGMGLALPTKALLTLLAGALLGTMVGSAATLIGVLAGTSILFFGARYVLRERVAKHLSARAKQIEQRVSNRPIRTMIGLRLFIALPYGPCTITAALSSMRYRDFLVGTLIGDIPVILLYSIAGQRLSTLASTSEALSPLTVAILIAAGLLFLVGTLLGRKQRA